MAEISYKRIEEGLVTFGYIFSSLETLIEEEIPTVLKVIPYCKQTNRVIAVKTLVTANLDEFILELTISK